MLDFLGHHAAAGRAPDGAEGGGSRSSFEAVTRQQVRATIIETMADAERDGRCPLAAAEAAFPGIPGVVLGECFAEMSMNEADAWWHAVEWTIDGEIIRKAITEAGAP